MSILENGHRIGKSPYIGRDDNSVMQSIIRQPQFIKDPDIAIEGLNEAFVIYRQTLNSCGISEEDISNRVDKTSRSITTRKKARAFIETVYELSSPPNTKTEDPSS